jgi:hypothetical protein
MHADLADLHALQVMNKVAVISHDLGRGGAAIAFCAQVFGAEEVGERFTGPGSKLIHAGIRIGT